MRLPVPRSAFESDFVLDGPQSAAADILSTPTGDGAYMWGPVGRGKTWLLDRYFTHAGTSAKKRVHFHRFFADLHASYYRNGFSIDAAVDDLLDSTELLCFDEFHVHDIGDARLIERMLGTLYARGVSLVVTSNYPPDGLLPNPLFHDAFVPTIELLKSRMRIVHVDGPVDYRTHGVSCSRFGSGFWSLAPTDSGTSFADLCESPKSPSDYLAMLEVTESLTIHGIPPLDSVGSDAAQRFSNLVDILYDRDLPARFHASVPLTEFGLGCGGLDAERMLSRLSELQLHNETQGELQI